MSLRGVFCRSNLHIGEGIASLAWPPPVPAVLAQAGQAGWKNTCLRNDIFQEVQDFEKVYERNQTRLMGALISW